MLQKMQYRQTTNSH